MEFASRGARLLALAAGLAVLAGSCRGRKPPRPRHDQTFTLDGSVRDKGGRGVPGANVVLVQRRDAGAPPLGPRRTRSSDGGTFRFENLPQGRYAVVVEALGLGAVEPAPVDVPGPPVEVRVPGGVRWLNGQVVDARGLPAPASHVSLGGEGAQLTRETLTEDRQGHFSFAVLESGGGYALRAWRGTEVSPTFVPAPSMKGGIVLTLGPGVVVAGQVVDDGGAGVGGVEVRAEAAADDPLPAVATARPDGGFRLDPLPPGRVRVVASAPGHVLREAPTLDLAPAKAPPPQRLVLVRGAALSGHVVDARGAPVAGADVRCVGAGARDALADLAVLDGLLPPAAEAAALPGTVGRAVGATKTARSDARGAFQLQDLLPGPLRLEIARPPFAPLGLDLGPVGPGARRDLGALTLRDAAPVGGHVLDERGAPIAGARVAVSPQVGVFAETDGGGAFTLALPPGAYTLTAAAPGFAAQTVPVTVAASGAPPPVELRLAAGGGALEGLALDSGHRPLARARVRAFAQDARAGAPVSTATTDAGGHFKLTHLPARALWVEVDHPSYPVTGAPAMPGTPVQLTADIPGGVELEVREHVTGAAVPRARVEAGGPQDQKATGVASKGGAGAFRLLRLRPGRWMITATAPGYRPATREVEVPASTILGEASVKGVRIELDVASR